MPTITLRNLDLDQLRSLAHQLTKSLPAKIAIGLVGTLGVGKTTFTQLLAEAAGVNREDVTSPTFTLLCSYKAKVHAGEITLHHLDAYRIADEDEFLELGVEELFEDPNTWTLVEWADRVESVMPRETLWITLDIQENASIESLNAISDRAPLRVITLSTNDDRLSDCIASLAKT